jgi:hypothetical protein
MKAHKNGGEPNRKKQIRLRHEGIILHSFAIDTKSTYMQEKAIRKINEENPENIEKAKEIAQEVCRMLNINEKFKAVCPALSEEEFSDLEALIIKNKRVIMPIILWNDDIIDGHNRYAIATKHNIPFTTTAEEFASEEEALIWIIENQMSRRNLNDFQKIELALKKEDIIAAQAKERQGKRNDLNIPQQIGECQKGEVNETLGKMAGVSDETIRRVKIILKEATEEQKAKLRAGEVKIGKVYRELKPKPINPDKVLKGKITKEEKLAEELRNAKNLVDEIYLKQIKLAGKQRRDEEARKMRESEPVKPFDIEDSIKRGEEYRKNRTKEDIERERVLFAEECKQKEEDDRRFKEKMNNPNYWSDNFGVQETTLEGDEKRQALFKEIIEAGTKALAKKYHPDCTKGDSSLFAALQSAKDYLMSFFVGKKPSNNSKEWEESPNDNMPVG